MKRFYEQLKPYENFLSMAKNKKNFILNSEASRVLKLVYKALYSTDPLTCCSKRWIMRIAFDYFEYQRQITGLPEQKKRGRPRK